MEAGCIPLKVKRVAALKSARAKLRGALAYLEKAGDDPDKCISYVESAWSLAFEALGQRVDGFVDHYKALGLADLVEHYKSS